MDSTENKSLGRGAQAGWVKVHRMFASEPVFQDEYLWRLYCWLLIHARHDAGSVGMGSGKGKRIFRLKVGQVVTGRMRLAAELNWPESSLKNRIQKLEQLGLVSLQVDSQFTVVTIMNYQADQFITPKEKDKQRTSKGQAKDKRKTLKEQSIANHQSGDEQSMDTNKNEQECIEPGKGKNKKNLSRERVCANPALAPLDNPMNAIDVLSHASEIVTVIGSEKDPYRQSLEEQLRKKEYRCYMITQSVASFECSRQQEKQECFDRALRASEQTGFENQFKVYRSREEKDREWEEWKKLQEEIRDMKKSWKAREASIQKFRDYFEPVQLQTSVQTFWGYWTGADWKRRGKPVDWKHELNLWIWRDFEKASSRRFRPTQTQS